MDLFAALTLGFDSVEAMLAAAATHGIGPSYKEARPPPPPPPSPAAGFLIGFFK